MPTFEDKDDLVKKAFETLKLTPTVERGAIRKAALKLLKTLHTDKNRNVSHLDSAEINNARDILNDLSDSDLQEHVNRLSKERTDALSSNRANSVSTLSNPVKLPAFILVNPNQLRYQASFSQVHFQPPRTISSKLLLIGGLNCGKNDFYNYGFQSTSGASLDFKVLRSDLVTYQIFNMAGQERFRELTKKYYQSASLLFFFDNNLNPIHDWIEKNKAQETPLMLYALSCANNEIKLEQVSTRLQLGDLSSPSSPQLEQSVIAPEAKPNTNEVSRDQLQYVLHQLFTQLDNILSATPNIKEDDSPIKIVGQGPAPDSDSGSGCTLS